MIKLSKKFLEDMHEHGSQAYPEECCGAMLGSVDYTSLEKRVSQLIRIENNSSENRHRRFEVTDKDYQDLEKKAKEAGLTLLGFYHTHPDHPSQPSQTDLAYAWPFFSYIILSVRKGKPDTIDSFILDVETNAFKDEGVEIEEG